MRWHHDNEKNHCHECGQEVDVGAQNEGEYQGELWELECSNQISARALDRGRCRERTRNKSERNDADHEVANEIVHPAIKAEQDSEHEVVDRGIKERFDDEPQLPQHRVFNRAKCAGPAFHHGKVTPPPHLFNVGGQAQARVKPQKVASINPWRGFRSRCR